MVVADAELARSRRQAEQTVVTAQADSQSRILAGRGESTRSLQVGLAEATVLLRSITQLRRSALVCPDQSGRTSLQSHPTARVPSASSPARDRRRMARSTGGGMLGTLLALLVAEKSGFAITENPEMASLKELADKMTKQVLETLEEKNGNGAPAPAGEGGRESFDVEISLRPKGPPAHGDEILDVPL